MSKLLLAIVIVVVHILLLCSVINTPLEKEPLSFDTIAVDLLVNHELKRQQANIAVKQHSTVSQNDTKIYTANKSDTQPSDLVANTLTTVSNNQNTHLTTNITSNPQIALLATQENALAKTNKTENTNLTVQKARTKSAVPKNQQVARYLYNPFPAYPRFARQRGWQGRVQLNLLISRVGKVSKIKLLKSSGYKVLDNSAMKTIQQWRFMPTQLKTGAVDYWYLQNINFQLQKKEIATAISAAS